MDEFEPKPVETHPILDALSVVATFRDHEDQAMLGGAESYLNDLELSKEDRRVQIGRAHV